MGGVKLVCEHGKKVGGCDCLGALEITVPCPTPSLHENTHDDSKK